MHNFFIFFYLIFFKKKKNGLGYPFFRDDCIEPVMVDYHKSLFERKFKVVQPILNKKKKSFKLLKSVYFGHYIPQNNIS